MFTVIRYSKLILNILQDKCRFDFISIYTVTATGGTRFGPYCGDTLPANITGEGNLFIEFTSDISNSFSGFSAVFTRGNNFLIHFE